MRPVSGLHVADFFSFRAFTTLSAAARGKAEVAAYNYSETVSVSVAAKALVARERPVSGNFFRVLRPRFVEGSGFQEQADRESAPPAVVLSHKIKQQLFGDGSGVVGQALIIDNITFRVVGVLSPAFHGLEPGDPTDLYVPMLHGHLVRRAKAAEGRTPVGQDDFWWVSMAARRASGVDPAQLQPLLQSAWRSTWRTDPSKDYPAPRLRVDNGRTGIALGRESLERPLYLLGALVGLVLLIACANIANLLLLRAMGRHREIALRVSLGCSRQRLMRQFATESAMLALVGGLLSLAVAWATGRLLASFLSGQDRAPIEVSLDPVMILSASAITAVTLVLFGALPAWRNSKVDPVAGLKTASGVAGPGMGTSRWRTGRVLVVSQIAFSLLLVTAAVLFTVNLRGAESEDVGFDRRNLVLFGIRPGTSGHEKSRLPQFYEAVERRLLEIPGVQRAGLAWMRPMTSGAGGMICNCRPGKVRCRWR